MPSNDEVSAALKSDGRALVEETIDLAPRYPAIVAGRGKELDTISDFQFDVHIQISYRCYPD